MRLGLGHGLDVGYRPELFGNFSLLQEFPGAAAAYSLRNIDGNTATNVVRVRRSSDNAEANFTAAEVSDGTMLSWVNADVVKYTSDFSATDDLDEINGTGAANIDGIAGVDNAYRFTLNGGLSEHESRRLNFIDVNNSVRVQFDYYIPSTNVTVDAIQLFTTPNNGTITFSNTDAWTSVNMEVSSPGAPYNDFRVFAFDTVGNTKSINADGDVFYLKNIVITQTTADGHVVTWYDQSGNGYNATQATANNQPKIVNAGALITQDGFAAVSFDGSNDSLNYSTRPAQTAFSAFTVAKCNASASDILVLQTTTNNGIGDFLLRNNAGAVRTNTIASDSEAVSITANTTALRLRSLLYDGTTTSLESETVPNGTIESYLNGSLEDNSAVDTNVIFIGNGIYLGSLGTTSFSSVLISEAILYGSDKSADRADIEAAINSHYSIY